jgi:hypothetical protein
MLGRKSHGTGPVELIKLSDLVNTSQVGQLPAGAFAIGGILSSYAPLASPAFSGIPTAPTNATATDASIQIATDAFVQNAILAYALTYIFDIMNTENGNTLLTEAGDTMVKED